MSSFGEIQTEYCFRCLDKDEMDVILKELHSGPAGGHFGGETTAHKILRDGYYWPTLF